MLQGARRIQALNLRHKIFAALRLIDQVHTRLVQRNRVKGRQDADVVNLRLTGILLAVTVQRQAVHHIDEEDVAVQRV